MRLFLLVFCFILFSSGLYAQKYIDSNDPDKVKSLLNKDNDVTGFGGIESKFGDFNKVRSLFVGAYGGVIINRNFFMGLAGYGLITKNQFSGQVPGFTDLKELNLYGGYGGLMIGGIIAPKKVVHLTVPVVLAVGNLYVSDENFFNNSFDTDFTIEQSTFFVIEPGLNLEVNISPVFRLAIGATYRMISGIDLNQPIKDDDLSDFATHVSFRFGRF